MISQFTFLALVASLATGSVQAQEAIPVELTTLVGRAWERAVAARTLEGRLLEADASRVQADSVFAGAPSIGLADRRDRWTEQDGARETEVSMSAPIWLPGQRAARQALIAAETEQTDAALATLRLTLAGDVRERTWALASAQAEVALAEQRASTAAALEADVARRLKVGDLAHADLLLARQESLAAQAALREMRVRYADAAAKMQILTGMVAVPAREEDVQAGNGPENHPRVLASRAARERAQRHLRYVDQTRRDAPEVGVLYRWERGAGVAATDRSIGVSVRIPLATSGRNRPREAAAQTEMATSAAEERQALDSVLADIQAAERAHEHVEGLVQLSTERVSAARDRASLIQKAFHLGEQSLSELLRAQAAAREAETAAARDLTARGLARARLNQSRGILP